MYDFENDRDQDAFDWEDFVRFVNSQPPTRKIEHQLVNGKNPWCFCAVGNFLKEWCGYDEVKYTETELFQSIMEDSGLSYTFECLNHGEPDTYDQLQRILAADLRGEFDGDYFVAGSWRAFLGEDE